MKENKKKILIGTGVAAAGVAAATAVSYTMMKKLVDIALDRKTPKASERSKQRLSGSTEVKKLMDRLKTSAEKLENCGCQTVELTSHDGERLIGHWHPAENPRRVIVAMHGWRSSWARDFSSIADFWHENDCSVLYAEQRGQGESGGEYMGFGLIERYDCLDWINWVNENGGKELPIYLAGISMGASTVLMAAGLELPENVRGIMADCGFTSPHAIWKHVMQHNLRLPYGGITGIIANDMCKRKIQIGSKEYSCTDALQESTVPVLFIHGTDDHFVPVEMTYENYKACTAPKRLLIVPGAEHGMSYFLNKEGYENETKKFWQDYDR